MDLRDALQISEANDVQFTFRGGGKLACNRFLLASRSPVFKAMLYGNMSEANSNHPDIHITDTSLEAFTCFIEFAYTDSLTETADVSLLFKVLTLARKYCFTELHRLCDALITNTLSPQNAGTVCMNAYRDRDFELVTMCLQVAAKSLSKMPASELVKIPLECMKLLVQADETTARTIINPSCQSEIAGSKTDIALLILPARTDNARSPVIMPARTFDIARSHPQGVHKRCSYSQRTPLEHRG